IWALEVPVAPHPERALRGTLERVDDEALRARLTAPLDELEAARDAVAAAAGDDSALDQALADLETRFTRLTGKRPTHLEGATYAGRTLVYEDCRRDIEMTLGPEFSERLGPPLFLLLQSARWFTYRTGERFLAQLERLFAEFQRKTGAKTVDFAPLKYRALAAEPALYATVRELQARWAEIFAVEDDARSVEFTFAELRDRVAAAFSAPHPGFPFGRYHSPDIMIDAESVEAIRRGNYRLVLGELHAGIISLLQTIFVLTHPSPGDVIATHKCDVPGPQVYPVMPRSYGRGYRLAPDSYADEDLHLVMDDTPSWRPPDRVLRIADLVVEKADGQLFVRTRDGAKRFHIIEVFHFHLRGWCSLNFSLLPPAAHQPRVRIDGLVVARESWRIPCRDLAFAWEKREPARFIGARRWAAARDLPRWVFARFPQERKPVYVDLESPACVELMAKLARRAGAETENALISVSEMLPTPEQAWLIDAEGRRYTSELRIVAVDPISWRRP
ncbi:MAG: lantibiotic dehydratase, partial [Alphaproteobacteria bacterium]